MEEHVGKVAEYGFKLKLDHKYPERWSQLSKPRIKQIPQLIPLAIRYLWYHYQLVRKNRLPVMDYINTKNGLQIYGVPIGGIGGGSIGRGFRGEFCRYALQPGIYQYETMMGNQFIVTIRDTDGQTIYNQVLSVNKKPKVLTSWQWGFDGANANYTALYPRSWTEYNIEEPAVKLTCRQISPVIPHNYKDSSLPCAVFVWEIENRSKKDLHISITFTFQSGTGSKSDERGEKWNEYFECEDNVSGVMIHQVLNDMFCTYAISSISRNEVNVTRMLYFNPHSNGESLWKDLETDGKLDEKTVRTTQKTKNATAAAVCASKFLKVDERGVIEFSLVWDMPKIHFYYKMQEYLRSGSKSRLKKLNLLGKTVSLLQYYTKFFYNPERSMAPEISQYTLTHYDLWEREIFHWQNAVLDDVELPDWYKSALFNELYYVTDGGTIWVRAVENDHFSSSDPRIEYGRFAYLEGHEYRMYNTYDVHFYASFALAQLWPNLQACIQYEYRDSVYAEDPTLWTILYDGIKQPRKVKSSVPHDMGDPDEEPFKLINAYPVHDVSQWKDLNTKFILTCYRDYTLNKNIQQLKDFWPTIKEVISHCLLWDKDNDGLIENGGFPDQTYDVWVMSGPSAYCGSLWLASLQCAAKIANLLDYLDEEKKYMDLLEKGKVAFQKKLWNGKYYNYDSSTNGQSKSIMSDQLCGQWLLRASGFTYEVFPQDQVKSSLDTIFNNNVMKYKNGKQGAVNGYLPSGSVDLTAVQSEEMWTGVTYGVAAFMIHEGMIKEGFHTASGAYHTVYEKIGMGFETPEALYEDKFYRAIGYMRPLSIWAMQHAWNMTKENR